MTQENPKFPDSAQAKKAIERLNGIEWPNFTDQTQVVDFIKDFEKQYFKDLEALPNVFKFKKPSEFVLPLFRVREFDPIANKDLISEYSYPPSNIAKIGRCNFPKRPVFYCSNNPMVALLETIRDGEYKDKTFCISKWRINPSEQEFVLEHFLRSDLPEDNPFKILVDAERSQLREEFKEFWNDEIEHGFELIQEFLHKAFISDKNYGLSATLAHRTIFAPHNMATDILIYPSVQSRFKGVNMAISPNFSDQQMHAQRMYLVKVNNVDLDKDEFKLTFTKHYAVVEKNLILWKKITPENQEYRQFLLEDFQRYLGEDFDFVFNENNEEP
ncbi:MAG: hypothetical protein ACJASM_002836 [Salibacteraceae bacterium]|jgi:hypothetical protein